MLDRLPRQNILAEFPVCRLLDLAVMKMMKRISSILALTSVFTSLTTFQLSAQENTQARFQVNEEFMIQRVATEQETGSVIAFTFNEFGQAIISDEAGSLLVIDMSKGPGDALRRRVYCDKIKACQGLLSLNGEIFATGDGPEGLGLYKIKDTDRNGVSDDISLVLSISGNPGEHGAHGIALGPDGKLYVSLGNKCQVESPASTSPYMVHYEGDLVQPRMESNPLSTGLKAPGGTIIRTDLDGKAVEVFAGGLRNAYDLAFDQSGELFTFDSDTEQDIGTSWYRPNRILHVIPGAEFGWRSGWAKWPSYYVDSVAPVCETGRGSPTGVTIYNHVMFPARYHNALFVGDWSEGRIICVKPERTGAGFTGKAETFLTGDPLNITDLEVGPDGALYFATGGRSTGGGIFRISWRGEVPAEFRELKTAVAQLIRQPQMSSAWSRQVIATLKSKMGNEWADTLRGVAFSDSNPPEYRVRALEIMKLYGPAPKVEFLQVAAKAKSVLVRGKVAQLLGLIRSKASQQVAASMLADSDPYVRRHAAESLLQLGQVGTFETIKPMLTSNDRTETFVARRMLQRLPLEDWKTEILTTDNVQLFVQGATAMSVAAPSTENSIEILARASELMDGFISDRDFVDFLRVMQLALLRGNVDPAKIPAYRTRIAEEFPSGNSTMNRELIKLLTYLQISNEGNIGARYAKFLQPNQAPFEDQLHTALYFSRLQNLDPSLRIQLLGFIEESKDVEEASGYRRLLTRAASRFAQNVSTDQISTVIENGVDWPNAMINVLYKLPKKLDEPLVEKLTKLDRSIGKRDEPIYQRLKTGLVAVLARSGDEKSAKYLKSVWVNDKTRRSDIAVGLSNHPEGGNWDYLVSSIDSIKPKFAAGVFQQLKTVSRRPTGASHYRSLILKGERMGSQYGGEHAAELLAHWAGEDAASEAQTLEQKFAAWRKWYQSHFPNDVIKPANASTTPTTPSANSSASNGTNWTTQQLVSFLETTEGRNGDATNGAKVFANAKCANCHRMGNKGTSIGPDLTSLTKRFTSSDIAKSVVDPSATVASTFQSKIINTYDGKTYTGIFSGLDNGMIVLIDEEGKEKRVAQNDIEEMSDHSISSMPTGLIDNLSKKEVADLFKYLQTGDGTRIAESSTTNNK